MCAAGLSQAGAFAGDFDQVLRLWSSKGVLQPALAHALRMLKQVWVNLQVHVRSRTLGQS